MRLIIASFALASMLAGCKKDKDPPKAAPGSGGSAAFGSAGSAAPAAPADAATADASTTASDADPSSMMDDLESPTDKVMKEAFGGKLPELPLLSKDGAIAAIDMSESIGLSDMSTYEVGFLDGKGKLDKIVLLDAEAAMADAGELKVTEKLKSAAAGVTNRIDGFTPFEKAIQHAGDEAGPVALGTLGKIEGRSKAKGGDTVGTNPLELAVFDSTGKPVGKETIKADPGGKQPGQCGGEPRLGDIWYDTPRKRVLARIYYLTGGDTCDDIPGTYRMWTMP